MIGFASEEVQLRKLRDRLRTMPDQGFTVPSAGPLGLLPEVLASEVTY